MSWGGGGGRGSRAERPPQEGESPTILPEFQKEALVSKPKPGVSSLPHSPAQEAKKEKLGGGSPASSLLTSGKVTQGTKAVRRVPSQPWAPGNSWLVFSWEAWDGGRHLVPSPSSSTRVRAFMHSTNIN